MRIRRQVLVNVTELCMEIDTEASVSIISESTKSCLFPDVPLSDSPAILKMYTQKDALIRYVQCSCLT